MSFEFIIDILILYLFLLSITSILERFLNYQIIIYIFILFLIIFLAYLSVNLFPFVLLSEDHVLKWHIKDSQLKLIKLPSTFIISISMSIKSYILSLILLLISVILNTTLYEYLIKKPNVNPLSYKFKYLNINMTDRFLSLALNWLLFSILLFILSNNLITLIFSLLFIIIFSLCFIYTFIKYVSKLNIKLVIFYGFRVIYFFIILFLIILVYSCNKYGVNTVFNLNSVFINKDILETYIYEIL